MLLRMAEMNTITNSGRVSVLVLFAAVKWMLKVCFEVAANGCV